MITPFEERLLTTLFPDVIANSPNNIATHVLHRHNDSPIFFKEVTDDVSKYILAHENDFTVYSVHADGKVCDTTEGWTRAFQKVKSSQNGIDQVLLDWNAELPSDLAVIELKLLDGSTIGYYPTPTMAMLKRTDMYRTTNLCIMAIHANGVVKNMTEKWIHYICEYKKLKESAR